MPISNPVASVAQIRFHSCNAEQATLFSVNSGVPVTAALADASDFLACALDIAYSAEERGATFIYATAYLIEMAKAVVDAALAGMVVNPER